uniref:Uncharacterized protein n=1 Tax=Romanomermis culicivorax TaxID=13658 RepID=A0A915IH40_ROMCU
MTQSQDPDTYSSPVEVIQDEMMSIWSPDYQSQASMTVSVIKMDENSFGFIEVNFRRISTKFEQLQTTLKKCTAKLTIIKLCENECNPTERVQPDRVTASVDF